MVCILVIYMSLVIGLTLGDAYNNSPFVLE